MSYHAVFMLTKSILKLMRQGVSKECLRFLNFVQIARVQRPGFIFSSLPTFIRRWQKLQSTSLLTWGFLCIWAYTLDASIFEVSLKKGFRPQEYSMEHLSTHDSIPALLCQTLIYFYSSHNSVFSDCCVVVIMVIILFKFLLNLVMRFQCVFSWLNIFPLSTK